MCFSQEPRSGEASKEKVPAEEFVMKRSAWRLSTLVQPSLSLPAVLTMVTIVRDVLLLNPVRS